MLATENILIAQLKSNGDTRAAVLARSIAGSLAEARESLRALEGRMEAAYVELDKLRDKISELGKRMCVDDIYNVILNVMLKLNDGDTLLPHSKRRG